MNKRPHAKPRGLAAFLPSRTDGLRLSVRPKIAYAISNDAIAIAERLKDLLAIRRQPVAEVGLCVEVAHSEAWRPPIPIYRGHRFRFIAATDSDASRPVF